MWFVARSADAVFGLATKGRIQEQKKLNEPIEIFSVAWVASPVLGP